MAMSLFLCRAFDCLCHAILMTLPLFTMLVLRFVCFVFVWRVGFLFFVFVLLCGLVFRHCDCHSGLCAGPSSITVGHGSSGERPLQHHRSRCQQMAQHALNLWHRDHFIFRTQPDRSQIEIPCSPTGHRPAENRINTGTVQETKWDAEREKACINTYAHASASQICLQNLCGQQQNSPPLLGPNLDPKTGPKQRPKRRNENVIQFRTPFWGPYLDPKMGSAIGEFRCCPHMLCKQICDPAA